MERFITIDIEYLHDELSKVKVMLPRQGYNREEMSLYDILAYMTRFINNVYLIKVNYPRLKSRDFPPVIKLYPDEKDFDKAFYFVRDAMDKMNGKRIKTSVQNFKEKIKEKFKHKKQ